MDPVGKTILCQYSKPFKGQDGEYTGRQFSVPYDVLVVAVSPSSHVIIAILVIAIPCPQCAARRRSCRPLVLLLLHICVFSYLPTY